MSGHASALRCPECGAEIAAGLLACPGCARLVHGAELERLAAAAGEAERAGDRTGALASWRRAIDLLPPGTSQREAIQKKMEVLTAAVDGRASGSGAGSKAAPASRGKTGAAAGVGVTGLALLKSKALLAVLLANGKLLVLGLLKLPTLLSMLVYLPWLSGRGIGFAVGLVATIYVHEMGHVAALSRYGIEASAPMFVPGFGAFVRMKQYPTNAHEEARTGLGGPLWGLCAAGVAAALGWAFGWHTATAVGSVAATINCFNLVPVWQLDGARGLRALSRAERIGVSAAGILAGLAFHQWMPAIVGAVTLARAFGADAPKEGDRGMFWLFASLVVALAGLGTLPSGGWT
jgi:Zn-dependent protease